MKTLLKSIWAVAILAFAATSCDDIGKGGGEEKALIDLTVVVSLPEDFSAGATYGGDVTLTNTSTSKTYTVTATDGSATFRSIDQGIYNIDVTQTLTQAEFAALAPDAGKASSSYTLKGSKKSVVVSTETIASLNPLAVKLDWFGETALLISKVFCNGTYKNTGNAQNWPKYWEIFNNSGEVVYLDGLCFAQAHGNTTGSASCELYDNYQHEATYAARITRFPGTHGGTQNIPVEPGKSLVLAWGAKNFSVTYQAEEKNNCTANVDLSAADYEIDESAAYFWSNSIGDNLDVPNTTILWDCIPTAGFLQMNQAVFIFFATEEEISGWATGTDASSYSVASQKEWLAKRVPNEIIIDAVETVKSEANQWKRIPDALDSEPIESLNNKGIIFDRKIRMITEEGRKILQDTNNSKNDFVAVSPRAVNDGSHLVPRDYDKPEIQPK